MQDTIIRLPEVKKRTGLGRSQIYDLIKKRKFPRQVEIGTRAVGWVEDEINLWIAGKIQRSKAKHSMNPPLILREIKDA